MDTMFPTFSSVCVIIQREETWKKTMNSELKASFEKVESSALVVEKKNTYRNKEKKRALQL